MTSPENSPEDNLNPLLQGGDQPVSRNVRTVRSPDLFSGSREIQIWHNGELYRLCITKNDKLILQK